MTVPSRPASFSLEVKKSKFLAEVFPVSSQEEARALIKSQKERYADARHVVHAFAVGESGGILGCSDDGEPSGTAGRPMLEVLKGSGLTNALLTVTRWFGGTLLGTGGLVKAYSEAAKGALTATEREELVKTRNFSLDVPWELHERIRRELVRLGAEVLTERFDTAVSLNCRIRESAAEELSRSVADLASGRVTAAFED